MDGLKNLSDRDLLIQLHGVAKSNQKSIEELGERVNTFVSVLESKVGRDEFKEYKAEARGERKDLDNRITKVESDLKSHCAVERGKKDWSAWNLTKILGIIAIIQFIMALIGAAIYNS